MKNNHNTECGKQCINLYTVRLLRYFFSVIESAIFTREKGYCFQRVLAIAILSVCPSVRLSVRLSVTRAD